MSTEPLHPATLGHRQRRRQRQAPRDAYNSLGRWPPMCPQCGGDLQRVPRRWLDRLIGLFFPLRRYSCHGTGCGWLGNRRAGV